MGVALMVLLPTFNALNDSYVTDVAPPAWLAKLIDPNDLPDDFQPPEDFKPPEDMELPEDFEIPPDWEPPPGYEGEIPPGGCPPPVEVAIEGMDHNGGIDPGFSTREFTFTVPKYTVAVQAIVTFTDWQAQRIYADLTGPEGDSVGNETEGAEATLLGGRPTEDSTEFVLQFITDPEDLTTMPPEGEYTLTIGADIPLTGAFRTEAAYAVYCGGMLE